MRNEKNLNRKSKRVSLGRNIACEYFYAFINNLNMSSSIWVLYLAYCGMNLTQIGLLEGIYHITSFIFEIPSGAIADLLGRKKTVIVGRICLAISSVLMICQQSFMGFALSFLIQALGNNFNSGAEEALVYDTMKALGREAEYMKINGRINTLVEVSQAIATVVGGILAEYSYFLCYSVCVLIAVVSILPALLMIEPKLKREKEEKASVWQQVRNHFATCFHIMMTEKRFVKLIVFYEIVFCGYCVLFFYSQQYFYELGLNKIQISIIMLFAGICSCIGALCSEWLYRKLHNKIIILSVLGITIGIIGFGPKHLVLAIICIMAASLCNAVLYPVRSNSMNELIPSEQRATLISVDSVMFSVFMLLCFPIAGVLADIAGLAAAFLGIGVVITMVSLYGYQKIMR